MQIEQLKAEAISNKLAIEDKDVYRQMMEDQLATMHQELTSWKASNYQVLIPTMFLYPYSPEDTPFSKKAEAQNVLRRYFLYLKYSPNSSLWPDIKYCTIP